MMDKEIAAQVNTILIGYDHILPSACADSLRAYWLGFEPNKGLELIKAEQRAQYESIGIPVPILKDIGKTIAKPAGKDVDHFLPLAQLLWDEYGREGRVISVIVFGAMELTDPERIVPVIQKMCRTCITWEDVDRLAMDALEPVVRKQPQTWLAAMEDWLHDESKWNRRAAITVIGRLPLKAPAYASQSIASCEILLGDPDLDVKRAVSFALRLCAKVSPELVRDFLGQRVPPTDPARTWVLCDVIRSLDKKLLPQYAVLLPKYENWLAQTGLTTKDRRSIESALKSLG